ncbi:MAG: LytTR family transcriptional regulator DNA-binding domain-containing protein, partial [Clostridia bacterium]|nr:LytTR family transcriptional regulator DNA-binding domain-containing protein [Clostridia bacterium]
FTAVFKQALDTAAQQTKDYIALSAGGEYRQIDLCDILYFETMPDHTINVEYKGGNFRFRSSLSALEQRLEGRGFLRAHRAYIISLQAISNLAYETATLKNGATVPVSRKYYAKVKEAMGRWGM